MDIEKNEKKKETPRWVKIFLSAVMIASACFVLVNAVTDIFARPNKELFEDTIKQGDYVSGTGVYATNEFFTVKHTVSGLIPIRTDYYYLVFNRKETEYAVVRAEKGWSDKIHSDGGEIDISGRVRRLPSQGHYAVQSALKELNMTTLETSYIYVDMTTKLNAVMLLIGAVTALLGALLCNAAMKKKFDNEQHEKAAALSGAFAFFIGLVLVIFAMC